MRVTAAHHRLDRQAALRRVTIGREDEVFPHLLAATPLQAEHSRQSFAESAAASA
jgi:hypothetical protein